MLNLVNFINSPSYNILLHYQEMLVGALMMAAWKDHPTLFYMRLNAKHLFSVKYRLLDQCIHLVITILFKGKK